MSSLIATAALLGTVALCALLVYTRRQLNRLQRTVHGMTDVARIAVHAIEAQHPKAPVPRPRSHRDNKTTHLRLIRGGPLTVAATALIWLVGRRPNTAAAAIAFATLAVPTSALMLLPNLEAAPPARAFLGEVEPESRPTPHTKASGIGGGEAGKNEAAPTTPTAPLATGHEHGGEPAPKPPPTGWWPWQVGQVLIGAIAPEGRPPSRPVPPPLDSSPGTHHPPRHPTADHRDYDERPNTTNRNEHGRGHRWVERLAP